MRARAGTLHLCPCCSYPRYVPQAAQCVYHCAMPRVRLAVDASPREWYKCTYSTTAAAWRRQPSASVEYEAACKIVFEDIMRTVEARCMAKEVSDADFFITVRRMMAERIAAQQQPDHLAPPGAAALQALDEAPAL